MPTSRREVQRGLIVLWHIKSYEYLLDRSTAGPQQISMHTVSVRSPATAHAANPTLVRADANIQCPLRPLPHPRPVEPRQRRRDRRPPRGAAGSARPAQPGTVKYTGEDDNTLNATYICKLMHTRTHPKHAKCTPCTRDAHTHYHIDPGVRTPKFITRNCI